MNKKTQEDLTKKLKSKEYDGHRWPVSRRDLLKLGLIEFSAIALMPSLQFFSSQAKAQGLSETIQNSVNKLLPLLVFDLAGGAGLAGNFVVGKKIESTNKLDLLSSYSTLGWNKSKSSLDTRFGLPMVNESGIRQGMISVWTAEQQEYFSKRLRFVSVCNSSLDDTSQNQLSIAALAYNYGSRGKYISEFTGTKSSASGGNSRAFKGDAYKSIFVSNSDSLAKLLSLNAESINVNDSDLIKFKKSLFSNNAKLKKYGINSSELEETFSAYGTGRADIVSTVVMNAIKGNTGPGVIEIGGYDYHDGTQTTGDNKDREIGQELGRALLTASVLNKPLFIQIITDGGVSSDSNTRIWRADSKDRSLTVFAVFDPEKTPEVNNLQIGAYNDGQIVDSSTYVGASVENATSIVFLNYLAASGVPLSKATFFNLNSIGNVKLEDLIVFKT
jgi:hypothetical protein